MIHNIRLGHACNSSSTHSIIPAGAMPTDFPEVPVVEGEYGWEFFKLDTPEEKMHYLAATIGSRLPPETVTELTGVHPMDPDPYGFGGPFGYVDHQSVMALPEGEHAEEFIRELAAYLRRDDVLILGGNDNSYDTSFYGHLPLGFESGPIRVRPDEDPNGRRFWTIMNPRSGDKARFSFDGQPASGPDFDADPGPTAGCLPELVDLKVTDNCPFHKDCPWCYMDSDSGGKDADPAKVLQWVDAMIEHGVYELALGGGEPTLWRGLPDLLAHAAGKINVNLTTKNIAWLAQESSEDMRAQLGAVAVSINNRRDLERLMALADEDGGIRVGTELTVQTIPAFCAPAVLSELVEWATTTPRWLRMTFLGIKRAGRALSEVREDNAKFLELLTADRWSWRNVAIDTAMAEAIEPDLQERGVDTVWYGKTEGAFSCYVDAVEGTLATSSYAGASYEATPETFIERFHDAQRGAGLR